MEGELDSVHLKSYENFPSCETSGIALLHLLLSSENCFHLQMFMRCVFSSVLWFKWQTVLWIQRWSKIVWIIVFLVLGLLNKVLFGAQHSVCWGCVTNVLLYFVCMCECVWTALTGVNNTVYFCLTQLSIMRLVAFQVQQHLFIGQERLFMSGGSAACGLFFTGGLLAPINVSCWTSASALKETITKHMLLWVLLFKSQGGLILFL